MITEVVALVESPAQLLNVVEWAHQDPVGPSTVVLVLAPTNPASRDQLARVSGLARAGGLDVRWCEVRQGHAGRAQALRRVGALVRRAQVLVLGDPFSGLIELFVTLTRAPRLVVVDDGSATVEFVELLESGSELVRWHLQGRRALPRPVAAAALTTLRAADLELFTVMPVSDSPLVRCRANDYAWTRASFADPVVQPGADLVGTSLVESGVVSEYAYIRAVTGLARAYDGKHYLAHRRESDAKLRLVERTGLEVVRPELPLELLTRRGPVARTLISFPSTIVHTLPVVLQGIGVELKICDVAADWFTDAASPNSASFLTGVTASARRQHQLGTAYA
jgi:hypothetical protein